MRIALYAKEFKQAEYAEEIIRRWDGWRIQMDMDYFQSPEKLLKILEEQSYDMIIFVSNGELKEEEHIRSIRKKNAILSVTWYMVNTIMGRMGKMPGMRPVLMDVIFTLI